MNDSKKNDSNKKVKIDSMDGTYAPCDLVHLVQELQCKVKDLEQQLQFYERAEMLPLDRIISFLIPTGVHLRIAEGRNFSKALAVITADLLTGHIRTAGAEVIVAGYPLQIQDITRIFRELQRALQRYIVIETTQRKEMLSSASSCILSTRLLKNVSAYTYRSVPKMLQFKKHLVRTVSCTPFNLATCLDDSFG